MVKMIIFETSKVMMNITTNFCRKEIERERERERQGGREGQRERERESGIWIDIKFYCISFMFI